MTTLINWAVRWNIPIEAITELQQELGAITEPTTAAPVGNRSESYVQSMVRLEATQKGLRLWRNNVGVAINRDGRPVRYGLCNDSKKMNEKVKSGDLIGIRPVLIKPEYVGGIIGQFVSRECKPENWRFKGTEHELAQLNFQKIVTMYGGDAAFCAGEGSL